MGRPPLSVVIIVKDDPRIVRLLEQLTGQVRDGDEVIVVDASEQPGAPRLRVRFPDVTWIDFEQPDGVSVTIPAQRNLGVREAAHDIVVFIDADCLPQEAWLERLVAPIAAGDETICAGAARSLDGPSIHDRQWDSARTTEYLEEAPTMNLAVHSAVFAEVGGFDESYRFGSDIDFTWRARSAGFQIRFVPDALIAHAWGTLRHRVRRAFVYGEARARLHVHHPEQRKRLLGPDLHHVAYVLFLVGLPVTIRWRSYPLLLAIPLLKNVRRRPVETVAMNLISGAGSLRELIAPSRRRLTTGVTPPRRVV